MVRGGGKRSSDTSSIAAPRKSSRNSGSSFTIYQRVLGNGEPTSSSFPNNTFTEEQIDTFVDNLTDGPQVISLPTPPDSHSIFVNIVMEDGKKKVMICDWNGDKPRFLGKKHVDKSGKIKKANPEWKYYTMLIDALEKKYGIDNVKYYDIDEELSTQASEKHGTCNNQGGCSEYMYNWIERYIVPKGYAPLYERIDTPIK